MMSQKDISAAVAAARVEVRMKNRRQLIEKQSIIAFRNVHQSLNQNKEKRNVFNKEF